MTSVMSIDPTLVIANPEASARMTIFMVSVIALGYILFLLGKLTYYFITPVVVFSVDQIGSTVAGHKPVLDSPPIFGKTPRGRKSENYETILLAVRDKAVSECTHLLLVCKTHAPQVIDELLVALRAFDDIECSGEPVSVSKPGTNQVGLGDL